MTIQKIKVTSNIVLLDVNLDELETGGRQVLVGIGAWQPSYSGHRSVQDDGICCPYTVQCYLKGSFYTCYNVVKLQRYCDNDVSHRETDTKILFIKHLSGQLYDDPV